jgi:aryl-alcohol dehydrogenase-like predicted oxidoreductase
MHLRTLGRTGLPVSPIGLGLAAVGRPGYINVGHADDLAGAYAVPDMQARAHAVLDAAWEAGIRYFDAARSYGRAEAFLGTWLQARCDPPGPVTIGSKWGYTYTAAWRVDADVHEVKDHTLPVLRRQIAETRERLGHHLHLYQIHSATLDSGVLDDAAVLDALAALRTEGVMIGLSLSGQAQADTLRRAMEVERDGEPLFGVVQATWNLLERSAGGALAEAHAAGMGVIVKEALANGRLTPRNDDPAFARPLGLLTGEADRLGTTVDALALAAVLARPWADVVLSGAATIHHLRSNVAAVDVAWDAEAEIALAPLQSEPQTYWRERADMAWN